MSLEHAQERYGVNFRAIVMSSIMQSVQQRLFSLLDADGLLKNSPTGRQQLLMRLVQQAMYSGGNDLMRDAFHMVESGDSSARAFAESFVDGPRSFTSGIVDHWYATKDEYTPTSQSSAFQLYAARPAPSDNLADNVPDLICESQRWFDHRGQRAFDVARTATIREAGPKDIPAVAGLYESALLDEKMLALLLPKEGDTVKTIAKRIALFRRRVGKGLFVRPNIQKQLAWDMSNERLHETGLRLKVDVLADVETDELYAFGSYFEPSATEGKRLKRKRHRTVRDYLERGETNGEIEFKEGMLEYLLDNIDDIILCGDMRATKPFVLTRLIAWIFKSMVQKYGLDAAHASEKDKILLAYRLLQLGIRSGVPLIRDISKQGFLLDNDKSDALMQSWGWDSVGKDRNPRQKGDHIRTIVVNGVTMDVNAEWDVQKGSLRETNERTEGLWEEDQRRHGDVSVDRPKKMKTA